MMLRVGMFTLMTVTLKYRWINSDGVNKQPLYRLSACVVLMSKENERKNQL